MLNNHHSAHIPGPDCLFFADLLPLLGEGALLEPEASEARAHLATCGYCRQEYAAYQRIEANLRRHFGALPALRFSPEDLLMLSDDAAPAEPAPDTAPAPLDTKRSRRRRVVSLFSLVAAVLVVVIVVTALVVSRALPQNTGTVQPGVSSPVAVSQEVPYVPDPNHDGLFAVQMLSPTEGWAVGGTSVGPGGLASRGEAILIVHYHNSQWWRAPAPSNAQLGGFSYTELKSIAMVSADEGWAVGDGFSDDPSDVASAFILHYSNGRWIRYGNLLRNVSLNAVQMLSPTNGWIGGSSGGSGPVANPETSLILHYDGIRWTPVQVPPVVSIHILKLFSTTDGWATGQDTILHYDGQQWTIFQDVPQVGGISMDSASDGWAISTSETISPGEPADVFWHYTGKQWVQSFGLTSGSNSHSDQISTFSMDSATDGWAIGAETPDNSTNSALIYLHYSQGHWARAQGPHLKGLLNDMTMLSANEGWAVGNGGVVLHYHNGVWNQYHF